MHKHLGKIVGIGIIVALVSLIFILNGHSVQITPWFGAPQEISAALLILICFIAGGTLTSLVGVFLGLRSSWRERGLKKKLAVHNKHWEQIVKGRELLASGSGQHCRPNRASRSLCCKQGSSIGANYPGRRATSSKEQCGTLVPRCPHEWRTWKPGGSL